MVKKQKICLAITLFLLLCAGVFAGQYWYNQNQRGEAGEPQSFFDAVAPQEDETDEDEGEESLDASDPLNTPDTEAEMKNTSAYIVDSQVCDNECVLYQGDSEALAYCQAVCGLAPTEGGKREAPKSCDDRTDTAKDICWRDKAVAENNASWCENIIDKSLRQSCHNRLAEEYFD